MKNVKAYGLDKGTQASSIAVKVPHHGEPEFKSFPLRVLGGGGYVASAVQRGA